MTSWDNSNICGSMLSSAGSVNMFSVAPTLLYTLALLLVFSSRMNHIISLILFYVPFHKCDLKNSKKKKSSDRNISKILGQEKLRSSNTLPVTLTCDQSDSAFIALHPLDPPPVQWVSKAATQSSVRQWKQSAPNQQTWEEAFSCPFSRRCVQFIPGLCLHREYFNTEKEGWICASRSDWSY